MHWDLFCRVVDNLGDIGVCWRLAADLAARGQHVRLFVDDASALQWMAASGAPCVEVVGWPPGDAAPSPGDVVIEAFGCELPPTYIARMALRAQAPVWINLEYLSAQGYVERSHRLRSPQMHGPGAGLDKWFFYPGFTPHTGGLIRESGLAQRRQSFDARAWLSAQQSMPLPGERVVSLFCYAQSALPSLLDQLSVRPTLLLVTTGQTANQAGALLGPRLRRGALRAKLLPALSQTDYDHLLWACDHNFVRGEDSFVRAQWAGAPFVWQAYPQTDALHLEKVDAFLDRFLAGAAPELASVIRRVWLAWNSSGSLPPTWPEAVAWRDHCEAWRDTLLGQTDLGSQLIQFTTETR